MLSDDAGAGPARHADRVEQTAGTSNAPSGSPRRLKIPLLRPAAGCAAHFVSRFGGDGRWYGYPTFGIHVGLCVPPSGIHVGLSLHFRFDQNICKISVKCFCAHACKNLHQKIVVKIRTHWANKIHASNFASIVHEFLSGRTTGNLQPATKSDASHLVKNCPSSPFPMNLYLDTGCAGHSSRNYPV